MVTAVDRWLAQLFDRDHIDETCRVLAGASEVDEAAAARVEAAQRTLTQMLVKVLTGVLDPPPATLAAPWSYVDAVGAVTLVAVSAAAAGAIRLTCRPAVAVVRDL